jgi:hypothetical protein
MGTRSFIFRTIGVALRFSADLAIRLAALRAYFFSAASISRRPLTSIFTVPGISRPPWSYVHSPNHTKSS